MRDYLILNGDREHDAYQGAIIGFARDGNRPALFRSLLALGLRAVEIKWHAAHPGWSMLCAF